MIVFPSKKLFLPILALGLGVALSACSGAGSSGSSKTPAPAPAPNKLAKPSDDGDLERRLKAELKRRYARQGLRNLYAGIAGGVLGGGAVTTPAASGSSGTDGGDFSKTNIQEPGVDEGDLVKTDGAFIYLARGTHFLVVKATPAAAAAVVSDIDLKVPITEIHLDGGKLALVTGSGPAGVAPATGGIAPATGGIAPAFMPIIVAPPTTGVFLFDVSVPDKPVVTASFDLPGTLQGSRRIDGTLYFVTNHSIVLPNPVTLTDYTGGGSTADFAVAAAMAEMENAKRIDALTLPEMIPSYRRTLYSNGVAGTPTQAPAVASTEIYLPETGNGSDLSLVIAIDTGETLPELSSTGIVSSWCRIYMSPRGLYLASDNNWLWIDPAADGTVRPLANQEPGTAVHKFAVSAATRQPLYRGSGAVDGFINDRFSMGEYLDHLRVGTTRGTGAEVSNQLTILAEKEGTLAVTGKLTGLAPGERIYSMRFDRDRGYMVTFRQTDPLFTLDLSDPRAPRIMGELKVTGFATYIHPIGPDNSRLLTIGRSANAAGQVIGNRLQMFDVSDLAAPKLLSSFELGSGWSDALYDPHAFLYYEPGNLLAIPFSGYGGPNAPGAYYSGLRVFGVDGAGISERGAITVQAAAAGSVGDQTVDRAVIIGNWIYAIGRGAIAVADVDKLETILTLPLP